MFDRELSSHQTVQKKTTLVFENRKRRSSGAACFVGNTIQLDFHLGFHLALSVWCWPTLLRVTGSKGFHQQRPNERKKEKRPPPDHVASPAPF